jgi:hypothetical protein
LGKTVKAIPTLRLDRERTARRARRQRGIARAHHKAGAIGKDRCIIKGKWPAWYLALAARVATADFPPPVINSDRIERARQPGQQSFQNTTPPAIQRFKNRLRHPTRAFTPQHLRLARDGPWA